MNNMTHVCYQQPTHHISTYTACNYGLKLFVYFCKSHRNQARINPNAGLEFICKMLPRCFTLKTIKKHG